LQQLEAMSYTQINSSQVLLQIAIDAGYSSIDEMLPGLEMLWDDVSALGGYDFQSRIPCVSVPVAWQGQGGFDSLLLHFSMLYACRLGRCWLTTSGEEEGPCRGTRETAAATGARHQQLWRPTAEPMQPGILPHVPATIAMLQPCRSE
jgi:hypothetical protein